MFSVLVYSFPNSMFLSRSPLSHHTRRWHRGEGPLRPQVEEGQLWQNLFQIWPTGQTV